MTSEKTILKELKSIVHLFINFFSAKNVSGCWGIKVIMTQFTPHILHVGQA